MKKDFKINKPTYLRLENLIHTLVKTRDTLYLIQDSICNLLEIEEDSWEADRVADATWEFGNTNDMNIRDVTLDIAYLFEELNWNMLLDEYNKKGIRGSKKSKTKKVRRKA